MRKAETGTALVVPKRGTQIANFEALEDKARNYAANALAERTQIEYGKCWKKFVTWCSDNDEIPMPAGPKTLALYVTWLAEGQDGAPARGRPRQEGQKISNSAISTMMSAIKHKHKVAGLELDMKNPALVQILDGIRRTLGQHAKSNRVNPITADDLKDMILACRPDNPYDVRDAAILAVGFGACRRRSEVVSLDYEDRTSGRGTLSLDDSKGVILRLSVSKTNQGGNLEEYVIPKIHARLLYDVVKNWVDLAEIKKGEPVFRSIRTGVRSGFQSGYVGIYWNAKSNAWLVRQKTKGVHSGFFATVEDAVVAYTNLHGKAPHPVAKLRSMLGDRLLGEDIAKIIKKHFKRLKMSQTGKKKLRPEEIERIASLVAKVSGHSLRVGHITTAAENGVPTHQIQLSSGHKTPAMIAEYTRVTDKIGKSSLKGMGL